MITLALPVDAALLASIGRVAIRQGQLDYVLGMTVKTIVDVSIAEARDATTRQTSRELRSRVRTLAKQQIGEGKALVQLDALLERARRLTEKRNDLLHSLWAHELDGKPVRRGDAGTWQDIPSSAELDALADEIAVLISDINFGRLDGFLHDALQSRKGRREPT